MPPGGEGPRPHESEIGEDFDLDLEGAEGIERELTPDDVRQRHQAFHDAKIAVRNASLNLMLEQEVINHARELELKGEDIEKRMLEVARWSRGEGPEVSQDSLQELVRDIDYFIDEVNAFLAEEDDTARETQEGGPRSSDNITPEGTPPPPPPRVGERPAPERRTTRTTEQPVTEAQRVEAGKIADNLLQAMRDEERNRLIQRGLDRAGFFRALFFSGRVTREVDASREYEITPEIRSMVEEYALQRATGSHITASGNEVFRLMQSYGFELDANGGFVPRHADSTVVSRLVHFDRSKTTGATFVGGMALGHATRIGLAGVLEGAALAVGAGAATGGIMGWLRGRREGAEATGSGESWTTELDAALATGEESQIELACHKVERIINDENARREFFRGRTRMEAARVLQRYQEGIRRLAMIRMSRDIAAISEGREGEFESEQARNDYIAERYAEFNRQMAEGEGRFMAAFGETYSSALSREVGIIAVASSRPDVPAAPTMDPEDTNARQQVEIGYNRDTARRRAERRRIVARNIIKGALFGAVAGGVGWYVGNWLSGLIGGGEHAAAGGGTGGHEVAGTPTGAGHEGVGAGAVNGSGGEGAGTGPELAGNGTEHHWGYFTNENTMPEQGFTPERAHELGFDGLMNNPQCPTTFIDGHPYIGTDQGAALREAVRTWSNQLDFHGMDQSHTINLMNFAGSHDGAIPVDVGSGYHISLEQAQAVLDRVAERGDIGIFDANQIMTEQAMGQAAQVADGIAAASPGLGQAAAGAAGTASEEAARGIWPGWMLVAGAAGLGAGYGIDSLRRNGEVNASAASSGSMGARNIGVAAGSGPFGAIGSYGRAEQGEEPTPAEGAAEETPGAGEAPESEAAEETPVAEPESEENGEREAELERLRAQRDELTEQAEDAERELEGLRERLKIDRLIEADDAIYTELESTPEGERTNKLAFALSERRTAKGYGINDIDRAWPGEENEDQRIEEYSKWDYCRAEEKINVFTQISLKQAQLTELQGGIDVLDQQITDLETGDDIEREIEITA